MIGAKINNTNPSTANTMPNGLLSRSRPPRPPVQNIMRKKKSEINAMIPTIVTARVMTRTS